MLCHPYLSLPFLDILSDINLRGFLIGATNILFKQKKMLFDVIVEVSSDVKIFSFFNNLHNILCVRLPFRC